MTTNESRSESHVVLQVCSREEKREAGPRAAELRLCVLGGTGAWSRGKPTMGRSRELFPPVF